MKNLLLTAMASLFLTSGFAYADCAAPPVPSGNFTAIQMAPNGDSKAGIATIDSLDNPQERGVIVFDWNANNLVVCDGTNWVSASVGTGGSTTTPSSGPPAASALPKYNLVYDSANESGWGNPLRSGKQISVDPTKSYLVVTELYAKRRSYSGVNYDGVARYQIGNTDGTYFTGELRVPFADSTSRTETVEIDYYYDPSIPGHYVPRRSAAGFEVKSFSGWLRDTSPRFGLIYTGRVANIKVYEITY